MIKKSVINPTIEKTENLSLNALFDISNDFEKKGQYNRLRGIRNALTHRFIKLIMLSDGEDPEAMTEDKLVKKTIELARIARNAIIYLLNFVYIEECKKKSKVEGILPEFIADNVPDHLKYL